MRVLGLCLIGLAAACSSSQSEPRPSLCADDPRVTAYESGLEGSSDDGKVTIRFVDADPNPPAKGDNTWKLEVLDDGGDPLDGAVVSAVPYMPDHGHGTSVEPTATPLGGGRYDVGPLYLFMPGVWQITFTVTAPRIPAETVVFTFCVDG